MKKRKYDKILWGIAIFSVLLLSACQINMKTEIEKNGSGIYTQEIGFQGDEASMSGLSTGDEDFCMAQMDSLPPNTTTRQETRNEDETWCVYETRFDSLNELRSIYSMTDTRINTLTIEDGTMTYDITLDLQSGSSMPMGADIFWQVTLPGKITDHNADEVDGNTLTWKLRGGENNIIHATSSLGGVNLNFGEDENLIYILGGILGFGLCCIVPIAIGVIVFLLMRRNKKKQAEAINTSSVIDEAAVHE